MGSHYIPRHYLARFADPENRALIWMYDKRHRRFVHAAIAKVAQEAGFYDAETEHRLNEEVEVPSHLALEKLGHREQLTGDERATLVRYIGTMMLRVPRKREYAMSLVPGVVDDVVERTEVAIRDLALRRGADPAVAAKRIAELEEIRSRYKAELPPDLARQIVSPWPSGNVLVALDAMAWRVVWTSGPRFFVTSDNPAYFFPGKGIGNPDSELTFPLAPDLMLHAHNQGGHQGRITYSAERPAILNELNRRLICGATRFIFAHSPDEWIGRVANKARLRLNRIRFE